MRLAVSKGMLPSSIIVILATALLTLGAALILFWAWRRGFFSDLDVQSRVIFEEREWRLARPWATDAERAARQRTRGALQPPDRGERGGSS